MEKLTLKRGCGLVFSGVNWKLVKDGAWLFHRMYVPNGEEPLQGTRQIRGREYAVFQCKDDDFLAQPVEVCRLPVSQDPMEELSFPEGEDASSLEQPVDDGASLEQPFMGLEQMDD